MSACEILKAYLEAGRIMQQNGCLCFRNGKPIRRHPLGYRGAVDELFGGPLAAPANASTAPVASTSQKGF